MQSKSYNNISKVKAGSDLNNQLKTKNIMYHMQSKSDNNISNVKEKDDPNVSNESASFNLHFHGYRNFHCKKWAILSSVQPPNAIIYPFRR